MKESRQLNPLSVFLVLLFTYLLAGPLIFAFLYPLLGKNPLTSYASLFIPSLLTFLVLILLRKKETREDLRGERKFSLSLFFLFFLTSFLILSFLSFLEGAKTNQAPLMLKLASLFVSLLFIPIQISVEEYIFRVIPLKAFLKKDWNKEKPFTLYISLLSGTLFTLPHLLNREVWVDNGYWAIIHYFLWGALAMAGCVISGGFEFSFAMHLSNNLVVSVLASYKGSSLQSIPFFILDYETSSLSSILSFVSLFAFELILFYLISRRKRSEG